MEIWYPLLACFCGGFSRTGGIGVRSLNKPVPRNGRVVVRNSNEINLHGEGKYYKGKCTYLYKKQAITRNIWELVFCGAFVC